MRAMAVRSSVSLTPGSSCWVHTAGLPVLPAWPKVAVASERRTPWPPYLQATPATRKLSSSGCAKLNKILRSVLNCRPFLQRSQDVYLDYTLRKLCQLRSVDTALGCFCEKPLGAAVVARLECVTSGMVLLKSSFYWRAAQIALSSPTSRRNGRAMGRLRLGS